MSLKVPCVSKSCLPTEDEIDVVTVVERDHHPGSVPRKRPSVSAPCSRQSSPTPLSPGKRKKHHQAAAPPAKRFHRLESVGSSQDGGESDDEGKRESHNILERKRRNDLKYSFQLLREQIPELEEIQRAPKVTILRKATEFIMHMQVEEKRKTDELKREQERRMKLVKRLAFLKTLPPV